MEGGIFVGASEDRYEMVFPCAYALFWSIAEMYVGVPIVKQCSSRQFTAIFKDEPKVVNFHKNWNQKQGYKRTRKYAEVMHRLYIIL